MLKLMLYKLSVIAGDDPYSKIRGRDLPSKIKKGERLAKPEQCDDT